MFEKEIRRRANVRLYDTAFRSIASGRLTAYNESKSFLVLDHRCAFPLHHVAKIEVIPQPSARGQERDVSARRTKSREQSL